MARVNGGSREPQEQDGLKLSRLVEYAERRGCRWKAVLDDFQDEEGLPAGKCGHCDACRSVVVEGGHTLTLDLPPEPLFVDDDVTRIARVFADVLNNAAKYSGRRPAEVPRGRVRPPPG